MHAPTGDAAHRAAAIGGHRTLFAYENKNAGRQRHNVEQENRWTDIQTEPQEAVEDQEDREQNHADAFVFHAADLLDPLFRPAI
jgi:hypothetical protein